MHLFHFLGSVSFPCKKRFNCCCYRVNKSDEIAIVYVWNRFYIVGPVLLGPVMPQTYLILIIQPDLVVVAVAGIKNPLGKTFSDRSNIFFVGSSVWTDEIISLI